VLANRNRNLGDGLDNQNSISFENYNAANFVRAVRRSLPNGKRQFQRAVKRACHSAAFYSTRQK